MIVSKTIGTALLLIKMMSQCGYFLVSRLGERTGSGNKVMVGVNLHEKGAVIGFHVPNQSALVSDVAVAFSNIDCFQQTDVEWKSTNTHELQPRLHSRCFL